MIFSTLICRETHIEQQNLLSNNSPTNKNAFPAIRELLEKLGYKEAINYRASAQKNYLIIAYISRAMKQDPFQKAIIDASGGRGRRPRLNMDQENLIFEAILEFHNNGTSLSRACVQDFATISI